MIEHRATSLNYPPPAPLGSNPVEILPERQTVELQPSALPASELLSWKVVALIATLCLTSVALAHISKEAYIARQNARVQLAIAATNAQTQKHVANTNKEAEVAKAEATIFHRGAEWVVDLGARAARAVFGK